MSKIDTINSKSNLDCIADELFTELTSEEGAVIEGGDGRFSFDSFYIHPKTYKGSNDYAGYFGVSTSSTSTSRFLSEFSITLQVEIDGEFMDTDTRKFNVGESGQLYLGRLFKGETGRLKFTQPGGFDDLKVEGTFIVSHSF